MKNTKKDFDKFSSRNRTSAISTKKSQRASKELMRRELMRAIEETGVGFEGVKIKETYDRGFGGKQRMGDRSCEGTFSESASGYGFVTPKEGGRDIFIPAEYTNGALGGDTVLVSYRIFTSRMGEEKTEGRVVRIISEGKRDVIGTVFKECYRHGRRLMSTLYLQPDDSSLKRKIYITDNGGLAIKEGDKVMARITRGADGIKCRITSSFGSSLSMEANYSAILAEFSIDTEFTKSELEAANIAASEKISPVGRVVRDEVILTIDSESAKDLDDAVSVEKRKDGWTLGVHIADVSHYVKEKTPLDRLAVRRGTSVYFTDKVIPMLPEALSNGACSLNCGEDKYALSCIIDLDTKGEIVNVKLENSIIRSRVRGVYSEINRLLSGDGSQYLEEKYRDTKESLLLMEELYKILEEKSRIGGSLELSSDEVDIILDEKGAPVSIKKRERGVSERIIEQFMITANVAVAKTLAEREIPCVYRIHEEPSRDKLEAFVDFAHTLGFKSDVISKDTVGKKELSTLLKLSEEKGIGKAVSYALLRSMRRAEYSDVRRDHYGLGLEYYCHFTSPIRRLPDLYIHRIIKAVLIEGGSPAKYTSSARRASAAATEAEEKATNAERRIEALYKVIYMSGKIGERFVGEVSSVTPFGFFVALPDTCEGLVPISELGVGYQFEEKTLSIRGKNEVYKIGDRVSVILEEADVGRGKLRFSIDRTRRKDI